MIIKLNLIPRAEKKRKFAFYFSWLNIYASLIFILLTAILVSFLWIDKELSALEREKTFLQQEKKRYLEEIKKIKQLEKENQEIKNRIEAVVNLKKTKGYKIKILDQVLLAVPLKKMYLTSLKVNDSVLTLSGFAIDYENVAIFLKRLENNPDLFKGIDLKYTKRKNVKGYNFVEFELKIRI